MRKRRSWIRLTLAVLACGFSLPADAQHSNKYTHGQLAPVLAPKREKPLKTQTLHILKDPPPVQDADSTRLVFRTAPASTDGLLSKQVRTAIRSLLKQSRKGRIVHLRAFVAGSGDTRRVRAVVSEEFSDKHSRLPSLSVVQVGRLPLQGSQVILESVTEGRKKSTPNGVAYISGQAIASGQPVLEVAPLARKSADRIRSAAFTLGLAPEKDVLRVTCFCSSLDDGSAVRKELQSAFPASAINCMQLRRVYTRATVTCEAVVRLRQRPEQTLKFENPEHLSKLNGHSQVALIGPGKIAFTGTQLAFRYEDTDVRLAFERIRESLEENGIAFSQVAMSHFYTLSAGIGDSIRKLRFDYFHNNPPPANTLIELEGLPSLDASFAMDLVAVAH